jgi:uncharacterized protein YukE
MADRIKVDITTLSSVKNAYLQTASRLKTEKRILDKAVERLKSGGEWDTEAGTEFFKTYEDKWSAVIERRITMLSHLQQCLAKAETEYTSVLHDFDRLKRVITNG